MAKQIEFAIPENYQVPEGTMDGQTFDESVTFKLKGDKLCFVEINGTPMPGYKDDDNDRGETASDTPLADRYQQAMMAAQQP